MKATITAAASTYVCALVAVVAVPRCRRLLILTQRGVESWGSPRRLDSPNLLLGRAAAAPPGSFRRRVGFFANVNFSA